MILHTFGDSHSQHGWERLQLKSLKIHNVGSKTAFSFGRDGVELLNISNYGVAEGDSVVFCYGEIDCRNHVHRHSAHPLNPNAQSYQECIQSLVEKYFAAVHANVRCFSKLSCFIFNIPPPVRFRTFYEFQRALGFNDDAIQNMIRGSDEERKSYALYMNQELRAHCKLYGYTFIDLYERYSDPEGFINYELSDGQIHIQDPRFLREWLEQHNLC